MAEPAANALGPRFAPDDPTLPDPWKGLIDGSTGVLYYWNPESNVTQYEKPGVPPPLPIGRPPSTPTQTPIPGAATNQPNGLYGQHGQQMAQGSQQQGQQFNQLPQQHGQVMPQQQMIHHPSQQMPSTQGPQMGQHPGQHPGQSMMPQTALQMPPQVGQQAPQGHHFTHQQLPYMAYQHPNFQQPPNHQSQQVTQGQQFSHQQDHKAGFSQRSEIDFHQGNHGFSPSQLPQNSSQSVQNMPGGASSTQIPPIGAQSGQGMLFGGSSVNSQQPASFGPTMQSGPDSVHQQHGPRFQNQMGPPMMHNQQTIGYEENPHGRPGHEFYANANKDGPTMAPQQQPKLAAIPMARSQQAIMMGAAPHQNVPHQNIPPGHPGGLNPVAPPHSMPNAFNHANGPPAFSNNGPARPGPFPMGPTDVMNLSPAEAYRRQHEVNATGDNVPAPFMTFEATGFPPELLRELHTAGFASPTPIQAQTWPIALQSKDIVAIAKTGSGKTLGYLLPAFMLLRQRRNNPQNGPTVLVLSPTRELATQIQDEAIKFGRSSRVSCTCLYGGAPKGLQIKELDRGADVVVATPGRLNDILEMKKIDLGQVALLVLDEADRMLDMGFEPQIRKIVNEMPPRRQTLMYTATWPKEVRKIAADLLVNPVQVNIGSVDELEANKSITQFVEMVPPMEKQRRLEQILRTQERGSKVIIFCSTKRLCDQLGRSIGRSFGTAVIHGDKSQGERDYVLNQFRSGKSPILVATDVAARGLDIKDIRVVINYDFPTGIEDYVHRIGRTGRAGATGVAYTFFSDQDWKYAGDLVKVLEGANQRVPPEVREMASRGGPSFSRDRGGMSRFDSGEGGSPGGGRWDSGGRGGPRDGGFGGRGGMRDGGFGGRGGTRDGGFGGRGGMRDGGFGGRGGMRDGGFGGRGGQRDGGFGGRGGGMRDGGFGGRGRNDRALNDRFNSDGRGRGRGRGRFDRSRGRSRSYSSSPDRVRTWGHSRSRSRSRSWSRSRSRSRSWSRSRSPRRSRSRSNDRYERPPRVRKHESKFSGPPEIQQAPLPEPNTFPASETKFSEPEPVMQLPPPAAEPVASVAEPTPSEPPANDLQG